MYSYGPPHMAGQKQDDQLEHSFCSYVRIRDVALKTYRRRWTIGRSGERESGISVLAARHDDDDDTDFKFLTIIHWVFTTYVGRRNLLYSFNVFQIFAASFGWYFQSHWLYTPMKMSCYAKCIFCFCISYKLKLLRIFLMRLSVPFLIKW